jgi:hypothetical protein
MKPFLSFSLVAALAIAAFSTGCQTTPGARDFTISLTSTEPVSFSGVLVIDGYPKNIAGKTPMTYHLRGSRVDCDIVQGPEPGELKIEVQFAGGMALDVTGQGPNKNVKGSFKNQ